MGRGTQDGVEDCSSKSLSHTWTHTRSHTRTHTDSHPNSHSGSHSDSHADNTETTKAISRLDSSTAKDSDRFTRAARAFEMAKGLEVLANRFRGRVGWEGALVRAAFGAARIGYSERGARKLF